MEDRVRLVAGDFGIKLAGVKIVPQPIGTFYDFLINMDGTATGEHCYRLAGVVDIGMHTTDFLLIKDMNDNLERASGSLTGGVFGIIESVRRSIVGKYDRDSVTIEEAENCVVRKQPIKIKGKTIKVSDIVNSHMSSTAQTIVGVIKSSWSYMGNQIYNTHWWWLRLTKEPPAGIGTGHSSHRRSPASQCAGIR